GLEEAYRSVHLFYKNTESPKLKNVVILNAAMEQLTDLDEPRFIEFVASELKSKYDRLDLRQNYSLMVVPGYLKSNTVVDKWAKMAYNNKVMLVTDFVNVETPDDALDLFTDANLTSGDPHKANVLMTCNYIVGRGKKAEVGEEEDVYVPGSAALAGKMYCTKLSQPVAGKTYGFVGVNDLVVVDTADATLIARRGETELVKQLVDKLKSDGNAKVTEHRFEIRPWGRFEVLADDTNFKAKTIFVDPNSQLSYQSHSRRSEHWIVVSGAGEVTIDSEVILISPGSHVHASVGSKHRIRNVREIPLQLIEIQLGTYFGEDDIVRYDDDYSRT
ncbi:MAG: cupin domain-containing protein, partial [Proteobacteria bacterium]